MKKSIMFGILASMIVLTIGVYAHGGDENDRREGYGMHDEVEEIIETGTYEDLEELREEYDMPIIHWIDSEEDFVEAQEWHEDMGGRSMKRNGCHGW